MLDQKKAISYRFSNCWNHSVQENWKNILLTFKIDKVLEIGSFEGQSICYISEFLPKCEFHCIDTWNGDKILKKKFDFKLIEENFDYNTNLAKIKNPKHNFFKYKQQSYKQLSNFISQGKEGYFDFIYVDGAHDSQNVLFDAICSFKLLKDGGLLIFDDYLWKCPNNNNLLDSPKFAIDSFVNTFSDKLYVIRKNLYQLYLIKTEKLGKI